MKKRRILLLISILSIFAIYVPAFFHILRLLDSIELSYKAFLYTGFVAFCAWGLV